MKIVITSVKSCALCQKKKVKYKTGKKGKKENYHLDKKHS